MKHITLEQLKQKREELVREKELHIVAFDNAIAVVDDLIKEAHRGAADRANGGKGPAGIMKRSRQQAAQT